MSAWSLYLIGYSMVQRSQKISEFIKLRRRRLGLTQAELAERAGVGLRFVRDLEQHKPTLRCDKVNQVLKVFGHILAPIPLKSDYENE